jgi:hypothetical protein
MGRDLVVCCWISGEFGEVRDICEGYLAPVRFPALHKVDWHG